jgi:hypothetical protein
MTTLLALWLALGAIMLLLGMGRQPSAGMPLAYFCGLSLIHTPGAAAYLGSPTWDGELQRTFVGFQLTIIGLFAFLAGVLAIRAVQFSRPRPAAIAADIDFAKLDKISLIYLLIGVGYFGMGSVFTFPSMGAFVAALSFMLAVGFSIRLWIARQQRNSIKFWLTIALLPSLPLMTVVQQGFIGFGTYWVIAVLSFISAQSRRRLFHFLVAPIVIFAGLSFYVTYMESRTALRKAIWFEQVGLTQRLDRFLTIFDHFQWFDLDDRLQHAAVVGRLNQNVLVGYAAERIKAGSVDYANGETLSDMVVALVPRALWPDKPQVGGGGNVVTTYTGLGFAHNTSVGAGQVLEFYVNFGTIGVIGGFLIWGALICFLDLRICQNLAENNPKAFLRHYLVCLALIQPGGNLVEIVVSVFGCAITSEIIANFVLPRAGREAANAPSRHDRSHNFISISGARLRRLPRVNAHEAFRIRS